MIAVKALIAVSVLLSFAVRGQQSLKIFAPKLGLLASDLALIVNTADNQSVEVANYYKIKRSIPESNIIRVSFPVTDDISIVNFNALRQQILSLTPNNIQAYAISWTKPWRVGNCMSITSAVSFGFDYKYCNIPAERGTCATFEYSPFAKLLYYLLPPRIDFESFYLVENGKLLNYYQIGNARPAMMLAGSKKEDVFALIDRGVAADGTMPRGTAYLMETYDYKRSQPRIYDFQQITDFWKTSNSSGFNLKFNRYENVTQGILKNKRDVLFYETGLPSVPDITNNTYLPGAIADHLTSYGGVLTSSGQMSVLSWLRAGATGSYGTVVEPCAYWQKFPTASAMFVHYFLGRTLLEAMWSSVDARTRFIRW
jgi:hypothetical protein